MTGRDLFGPVYVAGVIWLDKDPNEPKNIS